MKDIAIHSTSSINGLLEKTTKNTMENNLKTLIIKYIKDPEALLLTLSAWSWQFRPRFRYS